MQLKVALGKYCYLFPWIKVEEDRPSKVLPNGQENFMRTLIVIAAVALVGGAVTVWSLHGNVAYTTFVLSIDAPR